MAGSEDIPCTEEDLDVDVVEDLDVAQDVVAEGAVDTRLSWCAVSDEF